MSAVPHGQLENFYEAAFLGLQALESRPGPARRFGPNADARRAAHSWQLSPQPLPKPALASIYRDPFFDPPSVCLSTSRSWF